MAAEFRVEERWPELFEGLSDDERFAVVNALASNWHEGWVPNEEDVRNLTDYARGSIDKDEYDRRVMAAARRAAASRAAGDA